MSTKPQDQPTEGPQDAAAPSSFQRALDELTTRKPTLGEEPATGCDPPSRPGFDIPLHLMRKQCEDEKPLTMKQLVVGASTLFGCVLFVALLVHWAKCLLYPVEFFPAPEDAGHLRMVERHWFSGDTYTALRAMTNAESEGVTLWMRQGPNGSWLPALRME